MEIKFTPAQVAKAMGLTYAPNEQQVAAISAPTDQPSLVVAGAGSGKTELMALRVPWLVANRIARPDQILGLTFTRKAAASLSNRINHYLRKLRDSSVPDVWPEDLEHEFTPPTISTYNSYATALFRDYALRLGYDSDAIQLTEATAYQFARELINKEGHNIDPRIVEGDFSIKNLTEQVIKLADKMNEHQQSAADIEALLQPMINQLLKSPASGRQSRAYREEIENAFKAFQQNLTIAKLAEAYLKAKSERGRIDYSDQVALAYRAVVELGKEVVDREQAKFTQVLLDEYQDTSVMQTKLLSGLFCDKSVLAVGDPHQSIYGWRGASASNLAEFQVHFISKGDEDKRKAFKPFQLSVSWRNPELVLDLANSIAAELDVPRSYIGEQQRNLLLSVKRDPLQARPGAGDGRLTMNWFETLPEETKHVAQWLATRMKAGLKTPDGKRVAATAAVILRKRKHIKPFADALIEAGLDVEIVGLGGLLEMPEILDIRSALSVLVNPNAGSELIRLLTGARWRIGLKDIDALYRYANKIRNDFGEERDQEGRSDDADLSLVEALDRLSWASSKSTSEAMFSEDGLERLSMAAEHFKQMRKHIGLPLPELVRAVVADLWLDVELHANPTRKYPLMHINEFVSVVSSYCEGNDNPSILTLLEYLETAADKERLDVPPSAIREGVVQLITVHAAKGLEWDYVALGAFNDGDLPNTPRSKTGWLSAGEMPYPLRGDSASLPEFRIPEGADQGEIDKLIEAFKKEGVGQMLEEEERRLAYVAVTRAKLELSITGSYWEPTLANAKVPSKFLVLENGNLESCLVVDRDIPPQQNESNPVTAASITETWPKPVFTDERQTQFDAARKSVEQAEVNDSFEGQISVSSKIMARHIDLLLQEREVRAKNVYTVDFPVRIPASNFKAFIDEFEITAGSYLRPVPGKPHAASRTGNLFHTWVERSNSPLNIDDDLLPDLEDEEDFFSVEELQANYNNSRFAKLTPVALEVEVQLTVGANTFICKMDAVYKENDKILIVDWKTNKSPTGDDDYERKSLQLSLYRWAYAKYFGLPLEDVNAVFFFVGESKELAAKELLNEEQILQKWQEVLDRVEQPAG